MKKIIACLFALTICFQAVVTVKPDPLNKEQSWRVFDEKGRLQEQWKSDVVSPGQIRVYDNNGKFKGTLRPDPIQPGSYRGYDYNSGRQGSSMSRSTGGGKK
jgi:hypothetical protein